MVYRRILCISPVGDRGGNHMEHNHEHTDAVLKRLSRAIGHLQAVKRMVEEEGRVSA